MCIDLRLSDIIVGVQKAGCFNYYTKEKYVQGMLSNFSHMHKKLKEEETVLKMKENQQQNNSLINTRKCA